MAPPPPLLLPDTLPLLFCGGCSFVIAAGLQSLFCQRSKQRRQLHESSRRGNSSSGGACFAFMHQQQHHCYCFIDPLRSSSALITVELMTSCNLCLEMQTSSGGVSAAQCRGTVMSVPLQNNVMSVQCNIVMMYSGFVLSSLVPLVV
jgi:hypothetical protein